MESTARGDRNTELLGNKQKLESNIMFLSRKQTSELLDAYIRKHINTCSVVRLRFQVLENIFLI